MEPTNIEQTEQFENYIQHINRKQYILADILKKRKHEQSLGEERVRRIKERRLNKKTKQADIIHPEKFIQSYRKAQAAYSYYKKKLNTVCKSAVKNNKGSAKTIFDIPVNKTLVVVRIRGLEDISDIQKKTLQLMRLKKINTCVFIKSTPKMIQNLKKVENYIAYGFPTRSLVNLLILKRAHVMKDKAMVPLTTNTMVEESLGSKNLICIEDLVQEIITTGEHFIDVATFLCPIKLNHPQNGLKSGKIKKPFTKGGEWGFREEKINSLIESMI